MSMPDFRLARNPGKTDLLILFHDAKGRPSGDVERLAGKEAAETLAVYLKNEPTLKENGGGRSPAVLYPSGGKVRRIVVIGIEGKTDDPLHAIRKASAAAGMTALGLQAGAVGIVPPAPPGTRPGKTDASAVLVATIEGFAMGAYRYARKKDRKKNATTIRKGILLHAGTPSARMRDALDEGRALARATIDARDLANTPSNFKYPSAFAAAARRAVKGTGIKTTVLDEKALQKAGCGAILGVGQGSVHPPRMVILDHNPRGAKGKPIVLVGKTITFDTGGISLKGSADMHHMRSDMSGGAAVVGAIAACARLKIKRRVIALCPAAENMPGGGAYKPGDVITAANGLTIEVLNTDAEGRLVLADALAYAARYKPAAVVDIATLTGACVMALGDVVAAVLGTDSKVVDRLKEAGERTGEPIWELPLREEYVRRMDGTISDVKNVGGRAAGTITAAGFLSRFAEGYPWAHLDIAGVAWPENGAPFVPREHCSGFGARLFVDFVRNWK